MCKEAGIKEPEFIDFGDALRVNIYRPSYVEPINDKVNDEVNVEIKLSKNAVAILNAIKEKPSITRLELSKIIKKSESTVDRAIKELKNNGFIDEKTSDKNGEWTIKNSL